VLAGVFATSHVHGVTFDDWRGEPGASNTVYVGVKADLPIRKAIPDAGPALD
jgi:hypothetical protein